MRSEIDAACQNAERRVAGVRQPNIDEVGEDAEPLVARLGDPHEPDVEVVQYVAEAVVDVRGPAAGTDVALKAGEPAVRRNCEGPAGRGLVLDRVGARHDRIGGAGRACRSEKAA